jgi:hypothetical protein
LKLNMDNADFRKELDGRLSELRKVATETVASVDSVAARLSGVWPDIEYGLPCDCWDSRCSQYERLLRRASFLMQTASAHDPDMRKFIDEIERLVPSQSTSAGEQK